jgi:hypothetical protein
MHIGRQTHWLKQTRDLEDEVCRRNDQQEENATRPALICVRRLLSHALLNFLRPIS